MHNADLCDTLGNLVHRGTNLCKKYCGGSIPDVPAPPSSPIDFDKVRETYQAKMDNFELEGGAAIAMQAFRDVNGYLTEEAPWLKKGDEFAEERKIVVRATLEAIYALAHLLLPFIPAGATKIFEKLNTSPTFIADIDADLRNLEAGAKVEIGDVLFKKVRIFFTPLSFACEHSSLCLSIYRFPFTLLFNVLQLYIDSYFQSVLNPHRYFLRSCPTQS